jgi:hypothetical protein
MQLVWRGTTAALLVCGEGLVSLRPAGFEPATYGLGKRLSSFLQLPSGQALQHFSPIHAMTWDSFYFVEFVRVYPPCGLKKGSFCEFTNAFSVSKSRCPSAFFRPLVFNVSPAILCRLVNRLSIDCDYDWLSTNHE